MSREQRPPEDHTVGILGGFAGFFGGLALVAFGLGAPLALWMLSAIFAVVFWMYCVIAAVM